MKVYVEQPPVLVNLTMTAQEADAIRAVLETVDPACGIVSQIRNALVRDDIPRLYRGRCGQSNASWVYLERWEDGKRKS